MKLHGLTMGCLMICFGVAGVSASGCTATTSSNGNQVQQRPPPGGPPQGCQDDASLHCSSPDELGISCPAGTSPDSPTLVCSDPTPNPDGSDGYCCITWSGTCTEDPSVTGCQYPSYGFSCAGSDTPDQADPTLTCSTATPDPNTGDSLYCCVDAYSGGSSSSSSSSGGGSCAADSSLSCDAGSSGVDCPAGVNPDSSFGICSDPSPQSDGTDGYCCVTGTFTGCVQDDSVTASCVYPSFGFSCTSGSPDPSTDDPSLSCSTPTTDPNTGNDLYCCQ
jgi:hypothetical protein